MRTRAKELVQDHLVGEHGAFSFPTKEGGEEIKAAPYVYVSSLWDKVQTLLVQHERYTGIYWFGFDMTITWVLPLKERVTFMA